MRRQVCWTERGADGVNVDIRVTVHVSRIQWQFLRADREGARADNTTAVVARLGMAELDHATESPVCVILEEGAPA